MFSHCSRRPAFRSMNFVSTVNGVSLANTPGRGFCFRYSTTFNRPSTAFKFAISCARFDCSHDSCCGRRCRMRSAAVAKEIFYMAGEFLLTPTLSLAAIALSARFALRSHARRGAQPHSRIVCKRVCRRRLGCGSVPREIPSAARLPAA